MKGFFSSRLLWSGCVLWTCLGTGLVAGAPGTEAGQRPAKRPTVAVIPGRSDRVAPLADLLVAELSKTQRADLVERADLQKIAAEQELQMSFGAAGGKSRRRLGLLLRADFLVLLRITGDEKSHEAEIVIAETRFGYRVLRQTRKWDPKGVAAAGKETAAAVGTALDRFSRGVTLAAAIPPLLSRNLTHRFDHLQAAYARLAELEVARRPGCVVVELEEAKAIAKELATGAGEEKVTRPLPYYLVGEFRHDTLKPDSPAAVTLRLQHGTKQLAESSGRHLDPAAAAEFVRKTTDQMLDNVLKVPPVDAGVTDRAKELRTLLSRAAGFLDVGALEEAAALCETALLLEPRSVDALDGAVQSYTRMVQLPLSRRSPGRRDREKWEEWDALRKREMRQKVYQAIRASEHLTKLVQTKRYDSFYAMRDRVEGLWEGVRRVTDYKRLEGLDDERLLLEQARRDFLLDGFPHTWREGGWRDHKKKSEYTRSWFYLITIVGLPGPQRFPDRDWFDYRLKLFVAAYKGKTRWYQQWVLLPKACDDGYWAKSHGQQAVDQYAGLHAAFVERFRRACGDEEGFRLSLEHARLRREFLHKRKQPDLVAVMETARLAEACQAAGIREGVRACEELLKHQSGMVASVVPRFRSSEGPPPRRPVIPKTEGEIEIGPLRFKPVALRFTSRDARDLGPAPDWRGTGGGIVWIDGLVPCSRQVDVLWSPSSIAVMKEKNAAKVVFADREAEICDACWDGKWLWAGTRRGRILLIDPVEGAVRVLGPEQGVPDSGMGMVVCSLEPGRICAVGALPPHGRGWCATVTADGKVNVFHEARRIATDKNDAGADCAFKPCWIVPVKSADGKTIQKLLVCRDGLTVGHSSQRYHVNRYSLMLHPLVIDPARLRVEVVKAEMPIGLAELHRRDIIQQGEFLFCGAAAVKLADMNYQITVVSREGSGPLRRTDRHLFQLNGKLYAHAGPFDAWQEIDPKTVTARTIAPGGGKPCWSDYGYYPSRHYGILAVSRFTHGVHYEVSVKDKPGTQGEP